MIKFLGRIYLILTLLMMGSPQSFAGLSRESELTYTDLCQMIEVKSNTATWIKFRIGMDFQEALKLAGPHAETGSGFQSLCGDQTTVAAFSYKGVKVGLVFVVDQLKSISLVPKDEPSKELLAELRSSFKTRFPVLVPWPEDAESKNDPRNPHLTPGKESPIVISMARYGLFIFDKQCHPPAQGIGY